MAFNDSTLNATGSVWCRAYTADGFQVSLTLPASTAAEAAAQMDAIRAAGFLAAPSDATAGEIIETMTMCVRRETVNKHDETVPVIDCYFNGGKFKWVTLYLDDDAQRAEFERQSGLTVAKMPLYASQAPLQAGERATMKYETPCPRPFVAVKVPAREKEVNGVKQMTYKFARYGGQPASALPQPEPKTPIVPVNEHAFDSRKPDTRAKNGKETSEFILDPVAWVRIAGTGKPFYSFNVSESDEYAVAFERAAFREAGWPVDHWLHDEADGKNATPVDLDRYPRVTVERKVGERQWTVKHVAAYELCDAAELDKAS
jgi:hypothetical protein